MRLLKISNSIITQARRSLEVFFPGKRFVYHVLTLMTGTAIAQLLYFPLLPILTRLYEPDDFGALALFNSMAAILTVLATWRYDIGIVMPRDDDDAASLMTLAVSLAGAFSLASLLVFIFFRDKIAVLVGSPKLEPLLLLMPLSIFFAAGYSTFSYWSTRRRYFQMLAVSGVGQSVSTLGMQFFAALIAPPSIGGLVGGQVFGTLVGVVILVVRTLKEDAFILLRGLHTSRTCQIASRYHELPLHTLTTSFLNTLSLSVLPLILGHFFGAYIVGLVMLAQRLLMKPLAILSQALWQVSHAQLPSMDRTGQVDLLSKLHTSTTSLLAFPLTMVAALAPFSGLVFGDQWRGLERLLPAAAAMMFVNTVSNCTSYFAALRRYQQESVANMLLLVVRTSSMVIGAWLFDQYLAANIFLILSTAVYLGINFYWGHYLGLMHTFIKNYFHTVGISMALLLPVRLLFVQKPLLTLLWTAVTMLLYYIYFMPVLRKTLLLQPS